MGTITEKKLDAASVTEEYIKQYTRNYGDGVVVTRKGSRYFIGEGITVSFSLVELAGAAEVLKNRADRKQQVTPT